MLYFKAESKELWVCFDNEEEFNAKQQTFLNILGAYKGHTVAMVMLRNPRSFKRMADKYKVLAGEELIAALGDFIGPENVVVRPVSKKQ